MVIVADSSTIILASKVTVMKLVYNYMDLILIPEYVFKEVVEKGKEANKEDAILVENLIKEKKIKVIKIKDNRLMKELINNFKINQGEAEAITLAVQEKTSLLVDDGEAIKICKVYNINFITTLAFLIKLVKDKILDKESALIKIEKLRKIGHYSKDIIQDAIMECG